jgi:hypothetical protein
VVSSGLPMTFVSMPLPGAVSQLLCPLRVNENERAQLLRLGSEGWYRVGQLAVDAAANQRARRPYFLAPSSSCCAASLVLQ